MRKIFETVESCCDQQIDFKKWWYNWRWIGTRREVGDVLKFPRLHYKYESLLIGSITEVDDGKQIDNWV